MKTKTYHSKWMTGRTYIKPVGQGYETGFVVNGTPVFVGNFIHTKEATLWYNLMNREIHYFSKKYCVGENFPKTWYLHFVRNRLYKTYYSFLDRLFARYTRNYDKAFTRDLRKYRQICKHWHRGETVPFLKTA